jgi:hypothetical protein
VGLSHGLRDLLIGWENKKRLITQNAISALLVFRKNIVIDYTAIMFGAQKLKFTMNYITKRRYAAKPTSQTLNIKKSLKRHKMKQSKTSLVFGTMKNCND